MGTLPIAPNRNGPPMRLDEQSPILQSIPQSIPQDGSPYRRSYLKTVQNLQRRSGAYRRMARQITSIPQDGPSYRRAYRKTVQNLQRRSGAYRRAYRRMGHYTQHTSSNNLSPFGWLLYAIDYDSLVTKMSGITYSFVWYLNEDSNRRMRTIMIVELE